MPAKIEKSVANKALAEELSVLRHRRKLTIKQLAEKAGLPINTTSRILDGSRDINFTQLGLLSVALEDSPENIIRRSVELMGGLEALVSEQRDNVIPLRRKPEDMTDEELDAEPYAARESTPEAEADEQF